MYETPSATSDYLVLLDRMGTWNEELAIPLDVGEAQSCILQLYVLDATLREEGLKACTFRLGDFVPWNGYHLNVRQTTPNTFAPVFCRDDVVHVVFGGLFGLGFAGHHVNYIPTGNDHANQMRTNQGPNVAFVVRGL